MYEKSSLPPSVWLLIRLMTLFSQSTRPFSRLILKLQWSKYQLFYFRHAFYNQSIVPQDCCFHHFWKLRKRSVFKTPIKLSVQQLVLLLLSLICTTPIFLKLAPKAGLPSASFRCCRVYFTGRLFICQKFWLYHSTLLSKQAIVVNISVGCCLSRIE